MKKATTINNQEIMEITTPIITDEEYFALYEEYDQYMIDLYGDEYLHR